MVVALAVTVVLQLMIIYVPFFHDIFKIKPLTLKELAITAAVSTIVFWGVELEKLIRRRLARK